MMSGYDGWRSPSSRGKVIKREPGMSSAWRGCACIALTQQCWWRAQRNLYCPKKRLSKTRKRYNARPGSATCLPSRQQRLDARLEVGQNPGDGAGRVNDLKAVISRHMPELFEDEVLIDNEALIKVWPQAHIHARFPIIEAASAQDTPNQRVQINIEIKDGIGLQSQPIDLLNPIALRAADNGPRHQRIDIAVG